MIIVATGRIKVKPTIPRPVQRTIESAKLAIIHESKSVVAEFGTCRYIREGRPRSLHVKSGEIERDLPFVGEPEIENFGAQSKACIEEGKWIFVDE